MYMYEMINRATGKRTQGNNPAAMIRRSFGRYAYICFLKSDVVITVYKAIEGRAMPVGIVTFNRLAEAATVTTK